MGLFDKFKRNQDKNIDNVKSSQSDNSKGFKYLDKLIHSGVREIHLDYDIEVKSEFLNNEEKIYPEGVRLDVDNIVIDGNGHTIDAKGKIQIFSCYGKNITIKNITLKNGFSTNNAAAITGEVDGLNIENFKFLNNISERFGAIAFAGNLNIKNSIFSGNVSKEDGGHTYGKWGIEYYRFKILKQQSKSGRCTIFL